MECVKLTFEVQQIDALYIIAKRSNTNLISSPWFQIAMKLLISPSAHKLSQIFFETNIPRTCINYFKGNSAEMINFAVQSRNIALKTGKTPPYFPLPGRRVSPEWILPLETSLNCGMHQHTLGNFKVALCKTTTYKHKLFKLFVVKWTHGWLQPSQFLARNTNSPNQVP